MFFQFILIYLQDNQISLKQKNKPKPTISKLYFHRKNNAKNRISWKQISKGKNPVLCTHEEVIIKQEFNYLLFNPILIIHFFISLIKKKYHLKFWT